MRKLIIFLVTGMLSCNVLFANTWTVKESKNEFEGSTFKYVISNWVKPNKQLEFPYEDLISHFWKPCGSNKSIGIGFNIEPNLLGSEEALMWKNHFRHDVKVKIDGKILETSGEIGFGKKDFKITSVFYPHVDKILNSKNFSIQFEFYGGTRHFDFDLSNIPNC